MSDHSAYWKDVTIQVKFQPLWLMMIVIVGDSLDDVNCSPRPWFQAAKNGEVVFFSGSVGWCGLCPSSCYRFVVYGKPNVVCPSL